MGAGTSGSVLASRLTEDEDRTVLLLEAGSDPSDNPDVDIPIFADSAIATELDWQYTTVPQRSACKGHVDNVRKLPNTPKSSSSLGTRDHFFFKKKKEKKKKKKKKTSDYY